MKAQQEKPYSRACDNNKEHILQVLQEYLASSATLLEIGSGTGQHAAYFAEQLPHLIWYSSDRRENHPGILLWLQEAALANLQPPIDLDVTRAPWPDLQVDAAFTANTAHIMHWHEVKAMFKGVAHILSEDGLFLLYGPINYAGDYTSESNAAFDRWLKSNDPAQGLRDLDDLQKLATAVGLVLLADIEMPANNRILCWKKCKK